MKASVMAAVGAAMVGMLGANSAAQAALINFSAATFGGTVLYKGATLGSSTALDLDEAFLVVGQTGPGDASGLDMFDLFSIAPSNIKYGTGPGTLPGAGVVKSWTGDNGDAFAETLTTVDSIDRGMRNAITVTLSGTVSDSFGLFVDTPVFLILSANQVGGLGSAVSVMFTDATETGAVPEVSTWTMMALGFAGLGYAAARRRKAALAAPSA